MSRSYTRAEIEQRLMEHREEFIETFRAGAINAGRMPDILRFQLYEDADGTMKLADPDAFRAFLTDCMAAAFMEGINALLDVVFDDC